MSLDAISKRASEWVRDYDDVTVEHEAGEIILALVDDLAAEIERVTRERDDALHGAACDRREISDTLREVQRQAAELAAAQADVTQLREALSEARGVFGTLRGKLYQGNVVGALTEIEWALAGLSSVPPKEPTP